MVGLKDEGMYIIVFIFEPDDELHLDKVHRTRIFLSEVPFLHFSAFIGFGDGLAENAYGMVTVTSIIYHYNLNSFHSFNNYGVT